MIKKKFLLIGGEGYIGSVINDYLLERNHEVVSYDNLIYFNYLTNKERNNYKFINGDIRDKNNLKRIINNIDVVVILAGLVGDPITKKYPEESKSINEKGILNIINTCVAGGIKKLIFISTCSNYGLIENNSMANEDHQLNPLSLYSKSKVKIENYLMSLKKNKDFDYTILRFATAFGVSPRMRFDLTVNQFVKDIFYSKKLVIYDADTWRPYCHVIDFARLILKIVQSPKNSTYQEVFNVGSDSNNFSKQMILEQIINFFPKAEFSYQKNGVDRRNYIVDFNKLNTVLKFQPKYSVEYGINEIINLLKLKPINFYNQNFKFGNYKIYENKKL